MTEQREAVAALEIWQHPCGSFQLCTEYDGVGHRLCGPKLGGVSKLLKRHELTLADCDELERLIKRARKSAEKQNG